MKAAHSMAWKSSKQPRKQRKYQYNLPQHLIGDMLSVHLSKPLREKHGTRAVRARVGDKVKVLRGTHKGKEGKIEVIDTKNRRITVAKVETIKKEGGKAPYPLSPSNPMITELTIDKRRFKDNKVTKASKTALGAEKKK